MNQTAQVGIMVIGADSHFSYLMRRYVRTIAHQIIFANPGEDMLALVQREKPAAIVMEASIPDSMCWHMLRVLKTNQITSKIPVILCSWLDEEQRGQEEGADVYLRMPILYEDFEVALSHIGIHPCA